MGLTCIHLTAQVNLLTDAVQKTHGHKNIIDDNGEHFSEHDVISIRNQCIFYAELTSLLRKVWGRKQLSGLVVAVRRECMNISSWDSKCKNISA